MPRFDLKGDKEVEENTVSVRMRSAGDIGAMGKEAFFALVKEESDKKVVFYRLKRSPPQIAAGFSIFIEKNLQIDGGCVRIEMRHNFIMMICRYNGIGVSFFPHIIRKIVTQTIWDTLCGRSILLERPYFLFGGKCMHKCENCGNEFEGNYCPECGTRWSEDKICPKCATKVPASAKFCNNCGCSLLPNKITHKKSHSVRVRKPSSAERKMKVYRILTGIPPISYLLYSLLIFVFLALPVFGGIFESARSGYGIIGTDSTIREHFITMLIFGVSGMLISVGYVIAHFFGNSESENYCTISAVLLLLGQIILSSIVIEQIRSADSNIGIIFAGSCPCLVLSFSLFLFVDIIVLYFVAGASYGDTEFAISLEGYAIFEKESSKIANAAFENCFTLTRAIVPEGIVEIGDKAFSNCENLSRIVLPQSLNHIGSCAFFGCIELKDIVYSGTSAEWENVEKGDGWDFGTSDLVIHCLDRNI